MNSDPIWKIEVQLKKLKMLFLCNTKCTMCRLAWTSLQDLHSHREKPQEEGPWVLPQKNQIWWENCTLLVSFLQVTSQGESQQRKPSATISGLSVPMGSSLEATFCSCSPKCFHRATLIVSVSTYSGLLLHWSQVRQPSIFFKVSTAFNLMKHMGTWVVAHWNIYT